MKSRDNASKKHKKNKYLDKGKEKETQGIGELPVLTDDDLSRLPQFERGRMKTWKQVTSLQTEVKQGMADLFVDHFETIDLTLEDSAKELLQKIDKKHDNKITTSPNASIVRQHRLTPTTGEYVKSYSSYVLAILNGAYTGAGFAAAIADGFGEAYPAIMGPLAVGVLWFTLHQWDRTNIKSANVRKAVENLNIKTRESLEKLTRKYSKSQDEAGKMLDRLLSEIDKKLTHQINLPNKGHAKRIIEKLCDQLMLLTIVSQYASVLSDKEKVKIHKDKFTKYFDKLEDTRLKIVEKIVTFNKNGWNNEFDIEELYNKCLEKFSKSYSVDFPEKGIFGIPSDIVNKLSNINKNVRGIASGALSMGKYFTENVAAGVANAVTLCNINYEPDKNIESVFSQSENLVKAVEESRHVVDNMPSPMPAPALANMTEVVTNITESTNIPINETMFTEFAQGIQKSKEEYDNNNRYLSLFETGALAITLSLSAMSLGLRSGVNAREEKRNSLIETIEVGLENLENLLEEWEKQSEHDKHHHQQFTAKINTIDTYISEVATNFTEFQQIAKLEIDIRNDKVGNLKDKLNVKNKKIMKINQLVENTKKEVKAKNKEMKKLVMETEKEMKIKEGETKKLREELEAKEIKVEGLEEKVRVTEGNVKKLEGNVKELEETVQTKEKEAISMEEEMKKLQDSLQQQKEKYEHMINMQNIELQQSKAKIDTLKHQVEALAKKPVKGEDVKKEKVISPVVSSPRPSFYNKVSDQPSTALPNEGELVTLKESIEDATFSSLTRKNM